MRRSLLVAVLAALVAVPAAAASFDWPPSRVAAVRAVIYQVEVQFPIMRNPAYTRGASGIEVTCLRRGAGRYGCRWRATNTYSVIDGTARVRFAVHHALVRLRVTQCQRYKADKATGAVLTRCATH